MNMGMRFGYSDLSIVTEYIPPIVIAPDSISYRRAPNDEDISQGSLAAPYSMIGIVLPTYLPNIGK
jgi:hypothetical protein